MRVFILFILSVSAAVYFVGANKAAFLNVTSSKSERKIISLHQHSLQNAHDRSQSEDMLQASRKTGLTNTPELRLAPNGYEARFFSKIKPIGEFSAQLSKLRLRGPEEIFHPLLTVNIKRAVSASLKRTLLLSAPRKLEDISDQAIPKDALKLQKRLYLSGLNLEKLRQEQRNRCKFIQTQQTGYMSCAPGLVPDQIWNLDRTTNTSLNRFYLEQPQVLASLKIPVQKPMRVTKISQARRSGLKSAVRLAARPATKPEVKNARRIAALKEAKKLAVVRRVRTLRRKRLERRKAANRQKRHRQKRHRQASRRARQRDIARSKKKADAKIASIRRDKAGENIKRKRPKKRTRSYIKERTKTHQKRSKRRQKLARKQPEQRKERKVKRKSTARKVVRKAKRKTNRKRKATLRKVVRKKSKRKTRRKAYPRKVVRKAKRKPAKKRKRVAKKWKKHSIPRRKKFGFNFDGSLSGI